MSRRPDEVVTLEPVRHRRIEVESFGEPDRLRFVDAVTPPPEPGQVRVKLLAAGVGYADLMARRGEYLFERRRPFVPGYGLVGEVVDYRPDPAGPEPEWLRAGGRVAAILPRMGAYTEYRTLPIQGVVPVPDDLDTNVAAAMALDYLTAVSLLDRHGRVGRGDPVLIHGATGGVGDALCQLGTLRGLTMLGTASERSIGRLRRYDIIPIDYARQDVERIVRQHHPKGVRAVFDPIGGPTTLTSFRLLARGGVLVSYGFAGRPGRILVDTVLGATRTVLLGRTPGKRTAICSITSEVARSPAWQRATLMTLFDQAIHGDLTPYVGPTYPLEKASEAHAALERRETRGKVLLVTE